MFTSQYEARLKVFNNEYEFYQYTAATHEEAINKAKKHAKEYSRILSGVYYFNDNKFTLENIYTTN